MQTGLQTTSVLIHAMKSATCSADLSMQRGHTACSVCLHDSAHPFNVILTKPGQRPICDIWRPVSV